MNRYGRDFNSGRYTSHPMGYTGTGYDTEFGGYEGNRSPRTFDRWGTHQQGGRGWTGMGHSSSPTGLDESWENPTYRGGHEHGGTFNRGHFGEGSMDRGQFGGGFGGQRDFGGNRYFGGRRDFGNREFGGNQEFGNRDFGNRDFGNRDYGWNREYGWNRDFGGRGMQGGESRLGTDYDEDFGDRLRRGWDRLRDEARGWMGRGYDRRW
jgi:hypothetical protein